MISHARADLEGGMSANTQPASSPPHAVPSEFAAELDDDVVFTPLFTSEHRDFLARCRLKEHCFPEP